MSKITIGIACHKESELPDNDIYLPIHVGAANSSVNIPGTQRDDSGDNISRKNPNYCELTAQYWLWKNVDSDFYGLSHYRRFMSFAPHKFSNLTDDNRKQVAINSLNSTTRQLYYLDNAEEMRRVIEEYDVVATEEQDLSRVWTPRGKKSTVYEHFKAHDRDLININDLDTMLEIIQEKYPQYYDDILEYLNGPYFRGYNCFVMKKDLFNELCEFEFSVLDELEKKVDLSTYDLTKTRIYGFMGEILYSGFLHHLRKRGDVRIKDVQMLFFSDTEPKEIQKPAENAIPLCFTCLDDMPFLLDVTLSSFVASMNRDVAYDIAIIHSKPLNEFYKNYYARKLSEHSNLKLRFLDWDDAYLSTQDQMDASPRVMPLFASWILDGYDKVIMIDSHSIIRQDISPLDEIGFDGKLIAAAQDIEKIGQLNSVDASFSTYAKTRIGLRNVFDYFNTAVMVMNLSEIREQFDGLIKSAIQYKKRHWHIDTEEIMNHVFNEDVKIIGQHWNWRVATNQKYKQIISDAPLALFSEYKAERSANAITTYRPEDPWWLEGDDFELEFWRYAGDSDLYQYFNSEMMKHLIKGKGRDRFVAESFLQKFDERFPKGTKVSSLLYDSMPYETKRYKVAKWLYDKASGV